ncbi:hypothetical protein KY290_021620 [Solanum tuberosum]|uniref:F-box family protein n=1 Tax=Solanum tuberosum TaxID=4113 RepID=A0ABQ7V236_SOLTU|nr:hypothetical protein KY289_020789 [Solanum tuberosum]KAH0758127.1 hypothetical protein KY290_021620 [Solanum tuberosum]
MFYGRSTRIWYYMGWSPEYWEWFSPKLKWLNLIGSVGLLSEEKLELECCRKEPVIYFAYLVFKWEDGFYGLRNVKAVVRFVDSESDHEAKQRVKVVPFSGLGPRARLPLKRGDGWMELKMGNIFNDTGDVEARLIEFRHLGWKHGFIVQGNEFRPE